jgi:alkanesulfonate monooxygenase SsuD/methylene tetrahydromethanopterin reductase-like flavin-dependent oxidoreductase (luciferase family)
LKKSVALIGTLASWQQEQNRALGTYEYAKTMNELDLSGLTFEVLDDMGAVIVGTPERCIERVRRYQQAGCDQLLCLMNPYNVPSAAVSRSIELFGREVIPAFRSA